MACRCKGQKHLKGKRVFGINHSRFIPQRLDKSTSTRQASARHGIARDNFFGQHLAAVSATTAVASSVEPIGGWPNTLPLYWSHGAGMATSQWRRPRRERASGIRPRACNGLTG